MIFVVNAAKAFKIHEKTVTKAAETALSVMEKTDSNVFIYLITDSEIQNINNRFRGKNQPTNVLSFEEPIAFPHPELAGHDGRMLGEVYLAPSYIKKHKENIPHLTVHGILHLLGYNHEKERDKIVMVNLEKKIISKIA